MTRQLSQAGREQFALAILLLRDLKRGADDELGLVIQINNMCRHVGCEREYDELVKVLPPFEIKPKGH